MLFESPQWGFVPDRSEKAPRLYGGVLYGVVEVRARENRTVHVVPPSEVFSLLLAFLKLDRRTLVTDPVHFYVERVGKRFVLGLFLPNDECLDLWAYNRLPKWAV